MLTALKSYDNPDVHNDLVEFKIKQELTCRLKFVDHSANSAGLTCP